MQRSNFIVANIFFDDAFEPPDEDTQDFSVNTFVKQLQSVIDKAASNVHKVSLHISPPTKYVTPFGGRLEWFLPGGNKLVAHLKDKTKIRNKKRWSQAMYMHYITNYRTQRQSVGGGPVTSPDKTFILALDGDVDFKPSAVQILLKSMQASSKVGGVCGRVHPTGKGPLIWYQKFEYAISHWLMKCADHIIGCVLCSPGCFSLFRVSAIQYPGVLGKFSQLSTEAKHYLRFDLGEDRWFSSLLLEHGYRLVYAATADAKTFCPESFYELFNQRRRWVSADLLHTIDLIYERKKFIRRNEYISLFFILYQVLLFGLNFVKPGTVMLLMTRTVTTAFPFISLPVSLAINAVPILLFTLCCFTSPPKLQVQFGIMLTAISSLLVLLTTGGILYEIATVGLCSPTALFLLILVCILIFLAAWHPKEFSNMFYAFIYLLTLPCTYTLIFTYCVCNMNIVTWGTREVKQTKSKAVSMNKLGFDALITTESTDAEGAYPKSIHSETNEETKGDSVSITNTPCWLTDKSLGDGCTGNFNDEENEFWIDTIATTLYPVEMTYAHKKEMERGLKLLRNKMSLALILSNVLFTGILFIMEYFDVFSDFDLLSIPTPCNSGNPEDARIALDPIDCFVILMYGVALVIQSFAMVIHRCKTAKTIMQNADIGPNKDADRSDTEEKIALSRALQKMTTADTMSHCSSTTSRLGCGTGDGDARSSISTIDGEMDRHLMRASSAVVQKQRDVGVDTIGRLEYEFVKKFVHLACDLKKEKPSDISMQSGVKALKMKYVDNTMSRTTKQNVQRAITSVYKDTSTVLKKADLIQSKMLAVSQENLNPRFISLDSLAANADTIDEDIWRETIRQILLQMKQDRATVIRTVVVDETQHLCISSSRACKQIRTQKASKSHATVHKLSKDPLSVFSNGMVKLRIHYDRL